MLPVLKKLRKRRFLRKKNLFWSLKKTQNVPLNFSNLFRRQNDCTTSNKQLEENKQVPLKTNSTHCICSSLFTIKDDFIISHHIHIFLSRLQEWRRTQKASFKIVLNTATNKFISSCTTECDQRFKYLFECLHLSKTTQYILCLIQDEIRSQFHNSRKIPPFPTLNNTLTLALFIICDESFSALNKENGFYALSSNFFRLEGILIPLHETTSKNVTCDNTPLCSLAILMISSTLCLTTSYVSSFSKVPRILLLYDLIDYHTTQFKNVYMIKSNAIKMYKSLHENFYDDLLFQSTNSLQLAKSLSSNWYVTAATFLWLESLDEFFKTKQEI